MSINEACFVEPFELGNLVDNFRQGSPDVPSEQAVDDHIGEELHDDGIDEEESIPKKQSSMSLFIVD